MKGKKKLFIIIPAIVTSLVIAITSVGAVAFVKERQRQVDEWTETVWFAFSNVMEFGEGSINMTYKEIEEYEPQKDIYNSKVYYDTLTSEEKVLYNALEYAFDNNYVYVFVDNAVLSDTDKTMENIIDFMSLDSPFLQQNVDWEWYEHEMVYSKLILFKNEQRTVKGELVCVDNFSAERTAKVQKAVDTASKWDLNFPENATDTQKARAIFRYIDENIDYGTEKVDRKLDYLCTAVDGETNCDGFANIYSLLCNMNGLKCFEKYSVPPEEEESEGHTWNTVLLSDKWYNVDCTPTKEDVTDALIMERLRFGYSDEMQLDTPEYEGIFPESINNITPVNGHFKSCSDENVLSKICDAYRKSENDYIIVAFDIYDEEECDLFQKVANRLYMDIDIVNLYGDGLTLCYIQG